MSLTRTLTLMLTEEQAGLLREATVEFLAARGWFDEDGIRKYVERRYDYCSPEQQEAHVARVTARCSAAQRLCDMTYLA